MGHVALPDRVQKTTVLSPFWDCDLDLICGLFLDVAWLFAGDRELGLVYLDQDAIDRLLVMCRLGLC